MHTRNPVRRSQLVMGSSAWVALALLSASAHAQVNTTVDIDYSYQRFNNWCGSASVQMILSSPAVKNNNAFVADFLNAPDDPGVPANGIRLQPTLVNTPLGVNTSRNPQAFIYNLTHGLNTINSVSYSNPFLPYGKGSDTTGMAVALNLFDNPGFLGAGVAQGSHGYTAWNFAPNAAGAALATKQIANSLSLTKVAAQAGIGSGAHSIVVNGVTTDIAPTPNANYKVTGVTVSDPWTGFVDQQLAAGFPNPGGPRGFGFNAFVPHGYDIINNPNAPLINVPGVGVIRGRFKAWLQHFNVSPANPGGGPVFSTPGVQFITASSSQPEGVASIPLEVGGAGGNFFGLVGVPALANPIPNAAAALAQARIALAQRPNLQPIFPGPGGGGEGGGGGGGGEGGGGGGLPGNFDLDNIQFDLNPNFFDPLDGDWIIPYLPTGRTTYSGALVIDGITGDIDFALYAPDTNLDYTLDEITSLYGDLSEGIYPSSGIEIPEPSGLGCLIPAVVLLRRRR